MLTTGLVLAAVFIGSSLQRITGMGFGLVAAPFMVLLLGPVEGVMLVNICAAVTASAILLRVRTHIDWHRYRGLVGFALLGILPGAFVLQFVSVAWLEICIGVLVAAALTVSINLKRATLRDSRRNRAVAGLASGFMNATAGVGGPAVSVYAIATLWPHRSFAATMQPYFLTLALASVAAKLATGSAGLPDLPIWAWVAVGVACLAGLGLGEGLARVVEAPAARRLLVIVAYVGSVLTVGRGLLELLG
ncbi:sulfite exporter TauE/SafE family protein [Cryobacterium sp. CG_9.6]|uniref:sulfite exporter TauE/SafE family protein n=1 Tax=Cryobacterium sp. CG_9.6 TaxID=2760710 RepID=UPI002476B49B|nr:sulfite exporter TauE/SafE family protein [Cryobacterium sp. CG_9.6]MDH6237710.1 putative membrane protein YfcA [Cryobacterium sp. CG_9.6]